MCWFFVVAVRFWICLSMAVGIFVLNGGRGMASRLIVWLYSSCSSACIYGFLTFVLFLYKSFFKFFLCSTTEETNKKITNIKFRESKYNHQSQYLQFKKKNPQSQNQPSSSLASPLPSSSFISSTKPLIASTRGCRTPVASRQ